MLGFLKNVFEKKSVDIDEVLESVLYGGISWSQVSAVQSWKYWACVNPINHAIGLISKELATIPFVVQDEVSKTYKEDGKASEILELLKNPNKDKTGSDFKKFLATSFLVTGEAYLRVTGITRPQELTALNPAYIQVNSQDREDTPTEIIHQTEVNATHYRRTEDYTFMTNDGTGQMYQIIDVNPYYRFGNHRGFSRLSASFYEIENYIKGNEHNANSLKKGARPSGVIYTEEGMTPDHKRALKESVLRFYSGAEKANVMLLPKTRDFKELSMNNRDMEYSKLSQESISRIYNQLDIPASFYDNSKSTFNNKATDRANLYIFAVIPLMSKICEELTKLLIPRYSGMEKYRITFKEEDIPALQAYYDESIQRKSMSGIYTINELREKRGLEDIPGGDEIYRPISDIPIAENIVRNDTTAKVDRRLRAYGELIRKGHSAEEAEKIINAISRT